MDRFRGYDKILNIYASAVKKSNTSKQLSEVELSIFVKNIQDAGLYVNGML